LTDVDQWFNIKLLGFAELDKLSRSDRNTLFPSPESAAKNAAVDLIAGSAKTISGFDEDHRAFGISLDKLLQQGLIWRKQVVRKSDLSDTYYTNLDTANHYFLTVLGFEFVKACRRPMK
jgi:hypothetical protein